MDLTPEPPEGQERSEEPEEYMHCPFCPRVDLVFVGDPDASFSEMLGHIRYRHYDEDQTPAVLWPKIEIKAGE